MCSCGIPGGGWGPGFPTGVGQSGGGRMVVRSSPYPASFHWVGDASPAWEAPCSPRAASRSACRPAKPHLDLRAGLRAALRGQSATPTPLRPLRISSLAEYDLEGAERNPARISVWRRPASTVSRRPCQWELAVLQEGRFRAGGREDVFHRDLGVASEFNLFGPKVSQKAGDSRAVRKRLLVGGPCRSFDSSKTVWYAYREADKTCLRSLAREVCEALASG